MKKSTLTAFVILITVSIFSFINVAFSQESGKESSNKKDAVKECKKVCVKWEERRDCRPNPIPGLDPICAAYRVCVEWKEECRESQ